MVSNDTSSEVIYAIKAVNQFEYSFCKFVSPNDAGTTGAHQAGLYIPKNSIKIIFDEQGEVGLNKEKFANISWSDGSVARCRFIYYGQGTRDEYRITRIGKVFSAGNLLIIVKKEDSDYLGFILETEIDKQAFLNHFRLTESDTNKLINKMNSNEKKIDPTIGNGTLENEFNIETYKINFKPKAHILILLGEELIKNPVMAIYELIKNSYDADAKNIEVKFHDIENIDISNIELIDDGTGITSEILENVWFEPGTDYRKPLNNAGKRIAKRSPIYKRIPMGEKGVGRFAVHKLGNKIELISRPAKIVLDKDGNYSKVELLDYEITLKIDWRSFSQSNYLDDVKIDWHKNYDEKTFLFSNKHGTYIKIESLKEEWTRGMARLLKRQTASMVSPKNDFSKFSISLDFRNWWLDNIPNTRTLLETAPYKVIVHVDSEYNMTFDYSFGLENNKAIGERNINAKSTDAIDKTKYEYNIKGSLKPYYRDSLENLELDSAVINNVVTELDEAHTPYGNLMVELYSYDLDSNSLRDVTNNPKLVKELLKDHAGIKVFKGDLRVYDYGDPGNDWLGLDIKRVNNKEWFSNNQVIGFVYLDAETSGSLIEQTNREGFIHNAAYENFTIVLDFILSSFMVERQSDRQRWLRYNRKGSNQSSFYNQLDGFRNLITSSGIDSRNQTLLLAEADKVGEQYQQDRNALLIPAGVGMTASFAMHEIEKLVPRMQETVKENNLNRFKLVSQVDELKDYSEGLLSVLRKGSNAEVEVKSAIEQALSNYSTRMRSRKIDVKIVPESSSAHIVCDKRLFITMIMNILDNSMYWLDTVFKDFKGIYIDIRHINKGVSITIVDNGPGFKEAVEDIIRPYYSRKKSGIGIGMYLVDTVMIQYGRLEIINDSNHLKSINIPDIYDGAAVELIFNKNQL